MAELRQAFERYLERITLDRTRTNRITSAYGALECAVSDDAPIQGIARGIYLQGSFAHGTCVRPTRGAFDVDVVLALDANEDGFLGIPERRNPEELLRWLADRLRICTPATSSIMQRRRCIRIQYADEFHLDVVPAHCRKSLESALYVPDRRAQDWTESHPRGLSRWCERLESRTHGQFTSVVKVFKRWRDLVFADGRGPRSIVLEALVGRFIPTDCDSTAEAVAETADAILEFLNDHVFFPYTVSLPNPSLEDEDLTRDWSNDDCSLFRKRLVTLARRVNDAFEEDDRDRSALLWRDALGPDFAGSV